MIQAKFSKKNKIKLKKNQVKFNHARKLLIKINLNLTVKI